MVHTIHTWHEDWPLTVPFTSIMCLVIGPQHPGLAARLAFPPGWFNTMIKFCQVKSSYSASRQIFSVLQSSPCHAQSQRLPNNSQLAITTCLTEEDRNKKITYISGGWPVGCSHPGNLKIKLSSFHKIFRSTLYYYIL